MAISPTLRRQRDFFNQRIRDKNAASRMDITPSATTDSVSTTPSVDPNSLEGLRGQQRTLETDFESYLQPNTFADQLRTSLQKKFEERGGTELKKAKESALAELLALRAKTSEDPDFVKLTPSQQRIEMAGKRVGLEPRLSGLPELQTERRTSLNELMDTARGMFQDRAQVAESRLSRLTSQIDELEELERDKEKKVEMQRGDALDMAYDFVAELRDAGVTLSPGSLNALD